mgnify:FL=1|tara:strand:- start:652 stop:903 length:252 start_codon:yes stop_codon:yes gene_type:complete
MKDIDYDKKALEEKYKKYMVNAESIAERILNETFKEREQIALAKNKEWYKRELKKIKEAHNRGRSSILQDEMIARRRMRLKEV